MKTIIKGVPKKIFIQVGNIPEGTEFDNLITEAITWSTDKIFDTDIEYRLIKKSALRQLIEHIIKRK